MPAKPIDAAFILGIVMAGCCLMIFFNGSTLMWNVEMLKLVDYHLGIINGISAVMINCILIFGAYTRNSNAILAWIILAILSYIGLAIIGVLCVMTGQIRIWKPEGFFFIVFMVGTILFQIWTIIVAKNARKEIDAEPAAVV